MTDKEKIIIDGVDVSKCEFYMHYDYDKFSHGCSLHKDMFGLPVCCDIADCCKDCYFKQLARKTQECEKLKIQLMQKDEVNMFFNTPIEGWSNDPCGICPHKAENEELKKELNGSEKWRIKAESLNEKLDIKNTRYLKALEEIEKVINNILNSCLGRNTVSCRPAHNVCGDLINILDIINKAKDGE